MSGVLVSTTLVLIFTLSAPVAADQAAYNEALDELKGTSCGTKIENCITKFTQWENLWKKGEVCKALGLTLAQNGDTQTVKACVTLTAQAESGQRRKRQTEGNGNQDNSGDNGGAGKSNPSDQKPSNPNTAESTCAVANFDKLKKAACAENGSATLAVTFVVLLVGVVASFVGKFEI